MTTLPQAEYEYFVAHRSGSLTAANPLDTGVVRDFVMNTQEVIYGQSHQVLVNQIWDPPLKMDITTAHLRRAPFWVINQYLVAQGLMPDGRPKPLYVELLANLENTGPTAVTCKLHITSQNFSAAGAFSTVRIGASRDQASTTLTTTAISAWENVQNSDTSLNATNAKTIYPTRTPTVRAETAPIRNDFNNTSITNVALPWKLIQVVLTDFTDFDVDEEEEKSLVIYGLFIREVDYSWL